MLTTPRAPVCSASDESGVGNRDFHADDAAASQGSTVGILFSYFFNENEALASVLCMHMCRCFQIDVLMCMCAAVRESIRFVYVFVCECACCVFVCAALYGVFSARGHRRLCRGDVSLQLPHHVRVSNRVPLRRTATHRSTGRPILPQTLEGKDCVLFHVK